MKRKTRITTSFALTAAASALMISASASAATISNFNFTGPPWTAAKESNFATFAAAAPSVDMDVSSTTSTLSNSGHTGGGYDSFYIRDIDGFSIFSSSDTAGVGGNFGNSNATVPTNYIAFSVTPNPGFETTFASIKFFSGVNGSADDYFIQLRSFDGVSESTLGNYNGLSGAGSNLPVTSGSIDFTDFTADSATEFRLYLYGVTSGGSNGGVRLDDIILEGETVAIPEPSSALLGLVGLAFFIRRRRS